MSEKTLTIQELRVEINWFCGCGNHSRAADVLLKILEMHPLYEHYDEFNALVPEPLQYLFLYALDSVTERENPHRWGWFEHGSSIGGQWLTELGEAVRDGLRAEKDSDDFERLFADGGGCFHGFAAGDDGYDEHDCMAYDMEKRRQKLLDPDSSTRGEA